MKTAYEWAMDPTFAGLTIIDPDGWPRDPDEFEEAFFKTPITRNEFERRVMDCTIEWSLPKL